MQAQADPYAGQTALTRNYGVLGAALLLVSLVVGVLGASSLRAGSQLNGAVTLAGQRKAAPVLQASGKPTAILLDPETVAKMPADVYEWLKHLEECEKRRNSLVQAQLGQFMALQTELSLGGIKPGDFLDPEKALDETPPTKALKETEAGPKSWDALSAFFESKSPPAECVPTANAYRQVLGETSRYIGKVNDVMNQAIGGDMTSDGASKLIAELMKLKDSNKTAIDVPGKQTDNFVQEICDRYKVPKWFQVKEDIGGGMDGLLKGF